MIGRTTFRNEGRLFGIRQADRRSHLYAIGMTGTGKSSLLESMAIQDLDAGQGFALMDPHGDLVERVVDRVPESGRSDVIYWNVPDASRPLGFNPLDRIAPSSRAATASGLLDVFRKLWFDSWGPRTEHLLRNALLTLLDQAEATLADVLRLLDDEEYRKRAAGRTSNPQVRRFWLSEYEHYPARFRAEAIAPVQNKIGAFLSDPVLNAIVTQPRSSLDIRKIMDEGQVLLINLSTGRLGGSTTSLLGSLLVASLSLAGLGRANTTLETRRDFFVYLDEFHLFMTLSLATMLSELRKYRVGLVLAHQHLSQLDIRVRDAILGNAGSIISFRIGPTDAEILEGHFFPEIRARDLVSLPNYQTYAKLMLHGSVTKPFSAETVEPLRTPPSQSPRAAHQELRRTAHT